MRVAKPILELSAVPHQQIYVDREDRWEIQNMKETVNWMHVSRLSRIIKGKRNSYGLGE